MNKSQRKKEWKNRQYYLRTNLKFMKISLSLKSEIYKNIIVFLLFNILSVSTNSDLSSINTRFFLKKFKSHLNIKVGQSLIFKFKSQYFNIFQFLLFPSFFSFLIWIHVHILICESHLNIKFYLKLINDNYITYICRFLYLPNSNNSNYFIILF